MQLKWSKTVLCNVVRWAKNLNLFCCNLLFLEISCGVWHLCQICAQTFDIKVGSGLIGKFVPSLKTIKPEWIVTAICKTSNLLQKVVNPTKVLWHTALILTITIFCQKNWFNYCYFLNFGSGAISANKILKVKSSAKSGSGKANVRDLKSCFGRVFHLKLGSYFAMKELQDSNTCAMA